MKKTEKLTNEKVESAELSDDLFSEIWDFYSRFHVREREEFKASLLSNKKILLFRKTGDGKLVGMSTIKISETSIDGARTILFSTGSALLEPGLRGGLTLQNRFFIEVLKLRLRNPLTNMYFVVPAMSYKTYFMLCNYIKDFTPKPGILSDKKNNNTLNHIGQTLYGDAWLPAKGVIDGHGIKSIRPGSLCVSDEDMKLEPVRFFFEKNPDHMKGNAILCIIPVTTTNFLFVLARIGRKFMRKLFPHQ